MVWSGNWGFLVAVSSFCVVNWNVMWFKNTNKVFYELFFSNPVWFELISWKKGCSWWLLFLQSHNYGKLFIWSQIRFNCQTFPFDQLISCFMEWSRRSKPGGNVWPFPECDISKEYLRRHKVLLVDFVRLNGSGYAMPFTTMPPDLGMWPVNRVLRSVQIVSYNWWPRNLAHSKLHQSSSSGKYIIPWIVI